MKNLKSILQCIPNWTITHHIVDSGHFAGNGSITL